ncbi:MAG TPA: hypothetical protein VE954_43145 [Oligoflexus sp.]|uniref:hypothetical protein n=1 Tax=Oligoflexus sp. TaxID=1971216 RepID=UPI002D4BA930|nr:hypothetical protein [Oligoflexus sp.]HYX39941.1 hypothetical protein [Oligoflexus sp.]
MATKSPYVPNTIVRFTKVDCRQQCMKLLGVVDDETVSSDGVLKTKKKPPVYIVEQFCLFYIFWFMDKQNTAKFKIPLSREIRQLTGFRVRTIQRALVSLELDGSIRKENNRTYIVRRELANRCNHKVPTGMAAEIETPKWNQKQRELFAHMTLRVRVFENTTEDDDMQNLKISLDVSEAENRSLKHRVMELSMEVAELRGVSKTYREIFNDGSRDRSTDRTIRTYERGFDKARDAIPEASLEEDAPTGKPDIKLVPGMKKKNPNYDATH